MKVTAVSVYRAVLAPMKEGAAHAPVIIRVETDEGIYGAGEVGLAYGTGGKAAAQLVVDLARGYLIGKDPFRTEAIADAMRRKTFWGHVPGAVFGAAVSAIDEALWDIKGKALGQPIHVLLGGACRDSLRLYCNGWYRGLARPEQYIEAAQEVLARGFDAMKFDPMKLDASGHSAHPNRVLDRAFEALAAARVAAVREAVGDRADICVELHGNMWPMDSIRFGKRIAQYEPLFIEEVADAEDAAAAKRVADGTGLPVAAGERLCTPVEFRSFFELGALSVAQPDMGVAGGFTGVRAIAALAAAHAVYVQPHNCGGPIATAACVHLSFSIPNFLIQELFPVWPEDDRLDIVDAPFERQVTGGRMPLPTRPGLGVELNMDYLKRCERLDA